MASASTPDPMLPVGSGFAHCSHCGRYFINAKAFDKHRRGPYTNYGQDRYCVEPETVGLHKDERGYYRAPKRAAPAKRGKARASA